jgi:hypothetical protein
VERLLGTSHRIRGHLDVAYGCRVRGGELMIQTSEIIAARFFPLDTLPPSMAPGSRFFIDLALNGE